MSKYTLEEIATKLKEAKKVWLFAKGPSFNKDFPWLEATGEGHLRIACSQAVEHVIDPFICLMFDKRHQAIIPHYFQRLIYSELLPEMEMCHSSGQFAVAFIGKLCPNVTIHTVGIDFGFATGEMGERKHGFDYAPIPNMCENDGIATPEEIARYVNIEIRRYNITLERYEPC